MSLNDSKSSAILSSDLNSNCKSYIEKKNYSGDVVTRVSTASGNQGKLEGIFPATEKSGNLAFFKKIREKSGNFDDTIFFYILMT